MWLIAVSVALAASIAVHAAAVRLFSRANRPVSFLLVGSLAGIVMLGAVAFRYGLLSAQLAGAALTYAFVCEFYLFLFSSALTSISMNLIVRLLERPMSDAEIAETYDSKRMVARRIERLISTGLLRAPAPGRYEVTPRGNRLLRTLGILEEFFRNAPKSPNRDEQ